ncbi:Formyltransferase [Annulohypoxylon truncatum]|uniref:Formyltransferase n=1 Tax=Annulohypoxylon truncatum TaxID=327061 RepID=UPI002007FEDC|nr:Formyltransferase [Annulohypoxylon truncatum]KAI1207230.1 Formyltransferase [Annulohypoxylon truncatum]
MQPLLRNAAAAASIRAGSRRALRTAWVEVRALRPVSFQTLTRTRTTTATPPPPGTRRTCRQARIFSTNSGANSSQTDEREIKAVKKSEPLRVLFCGSDRFSCAALEALHREHVRDPALVESIDVVVRPGKRAGRGNRDVVHPPIRDLATSLGLPIHERDTFTGWDMPPKTNIIIAVSFGLFVPPRLLQQARFGGLNIHPSLLPDLRGPAPLHHALLSGRTSTGVTLQTLDPTRFDHGKILAQTPTLHIPPDLDYESLLATITPVAADLLIRGLREGVHVPPLQEVDVDVDVGEAEGRPLQHAPKITKADRQINARRVPELLCRYRVLGPLWLWSRDRNGARKRVIFERVSGAHPASVPSDALALHSLVLEQDSSPSPSPTPTPTPSINAGTGANTSTINSIAEEERVRPETTRLAVWVPKDKDADGAVYIGSHRVETVKVESIEAKPAARALKNFLVPIKNQDEEWEKAESTFILG